MSATAPTGINSFSVPDQAPAPTIRIGKDIYRHLWDTPEVKGDTRGRYLWVYYCKDKDDIILLTEANRPASVKVSRRIEIGAEVEAWLQEKEDAALDAEDQGDRICHEHRGH